MQILEDRKDAQFNKDSMYKKCRKKINYRLILFNLLIYEEWIKNILFILLIYEE